MNPPTEAATAPKGKPKRSNGITTPSRRGGSGRVLTDVIVDLGFVERDAMDDAVEMAHAAGSAAERVLLSTGAIGEEQLARAVAPLPKSGSSMRSISASMAGGGATAGRTS